MLSKEYVNKRLSGLPIPIMLMTGGAIQATVKAGGKAQESSGPAPGLHCGAN